MTKNLTITHNTDVLSLTEAVIMAEVIDKGYTQSIENITLKFSEYEQFITELTTAYNLKKYDFSEAKRSIFHQYVSDDAYLFCNGNRKHVFVSVQAKTLDIIKTIYDVYKKFETIDSDIKIYMTSYYMSGPKLDSSVKTLNVTDIKDVQVEYYPYIDTDIMFSQFLTLDENILVLAGKPGIGKTLMTNSILKYCTEHEEFLPYDKMKEDETVETQFIAACYVKSTEVLAEDTFWRELQKSEFDFVILDDLDYMLTRRSADVHTNDDVIKNKFINQFLSYTSGIESNSTKFIITTNQNISDIDSAILRKGRLFDILQLRSLTKQEALNIWTLNNLKESEFEELYSDKTDILPADLGSDITKYKTAKDFSKKTYLKEEGISYIETLDNSIGF